MMGNWGEINLCKLVLLSYAVQISINCASVNKQHIMQSCTHNAGNPTHKFIYLIIKILKTGIVINRIYLFFGDKFS